MIDPNELKEWRDAIDSLVTFEGVDYAKTLLNELSTHAEQAGLALSGAVNTPYLNTIPVNEQLPLPEDHAHLARLCAYNRWNTICMVMRAAKVGHELGGHISSYAAIAELYEVGLNYFFRGHNDPSGGDFVYFQGHSAEGIYARSYLEGRMDEAMLDRFRQESVGKGLSSYPHPWLMPDYWQFPTVSLGLGPIQAIHTAKLLRYLMDRELMPASDRHVWMYAGDGELGEPESLGVLNIAARYQLDNLTFVISCNLQRLDGPVWGDGQVIQDYEGVFRGAGWHVIKVIWGGGWDALFAKDTEGLLKARISELVDGEYQNYTSKDGAYFREHFFGTSPALQSLVADLSDEALKSTLIDGGHDIEKLFSAFSAARHHQGQPTVILAKTLKGFGLGGSAEGQNIAHNVKEVKDDDLLAFRDRFALPLTDEETLALTYYKPADDAPEMHYLHERRDALGGVMPCRREQATHSLPAPALDNFPRQLGGSDGREISSTMSFGRILSVLLKDKAINKFVVPIVADETRTFGMEGLFRQIGIYSPMGQRYTPEDKSQLMYYRESKQGQLLQEGICEAGAMSSWIAAATSYSTNDLPLIPFYIYYSMFGFQRIGDLIWAAGDSRARGFLIGGTAGRTTLSGEGLQHEDGHNVLMFGMVPNCVAYDPCFGYEMAVIIQDGIRRMMENQEDVFYYLTAMNENYVHPPMPDGAEEGIRRGLYCFSPAENATVQLMGSGAIFTEVLKAAALLKATFNIEATVWGATSFNELYRDMKLVERHNRLHPSDKKTCYVADCLADQPGPVIAATDYIARFAEQIAPAVTTDFHVLGTDGYGRSDKRDTLRDFFEVDANMIAYTALVALGKTTEAGQLGVDTSRLSPVDV